MAPTDTKPSRNSGKHLLHSGGKERWTGSIEPTPGKRHANVLESSWPRHERSLNLSAPHRQRNDPTKLTSLKCNARLQPLNKEGDVCLRDAELPTTLCKRSVVQGDASAARAGADTSFPAGGHGMRALRDHRALALVDSGTSTAGEVFAMPGDAEVLAVLCAGEDACSCLIHPRAVTPRPHSARIHSAQLLRMGPIRIRLCASFPPIGPSPLCTGAFTGAGAPTHLADYHIAQRSRAVLSAAESDSAATERLPTDFLVRIHLVSLPPAPDSTALASVPTRPGFDSAAAYATFVDGPAMAKMNPDAALEYWQSFFPSAAKFQASLAVVSATTAALAARKKATGNRRYPHAQRRQRVALLRRPIAPVSS